MNTNNQEMLARAVELELARIEARLARLMAEKNAIYLKLLEEPDAE